MKSFLKPSPELRNGFKDPKRLAAIHSLPCVLCFAKGRKQTTRSIAHHKIGLGMGKKASDLLTMVLCEECHTKGDKAIHNMPLWQWEEENGFTQDDLILMTNRMLEHEKF